MNTTPELFPASWNAISAIDRRCEGTKSGHLCAGSDTSECWWRHANLFELASMFERAMNLSGINTLLLKLEELRANSDVSRGASVKIPVHLLDEARRLLVAISGPQPGILCDEAAKPWFTLRPVQLTREAHIPCSKCHDYYASMVKEDVHGSSYLCYLHTMDLIVGKGGATAQ